MLRRHEPRTDDGLAILTHGTTNDFMVYLSGWFSQAQWLVTEPDLRQSGFDTDAPNLIPRPPDPRH